MKVLEIRSFAFGFLVCWTLYNSVSMHGNGESGLRRRSLAMEEGTPLLVDIMDEQQAPLLEDLDVVKQAPLLVNLDALQEAHMEPPIPIITTTSVAMGGTKPTRTLVVYSGPSTYKEEKHELYQRNLEYFLGHGGIILDGDCKNKTSSSSQTKTVHDTIIVVGHEFYEQYYSVVEKWKADAAAQTSCPQDLWNNQVRVVARRPVCYDMETARLAFYGGLGVDIENYDYFVFVNCGITGPGDQSSLQGLPWTTAFTSKLNDKVKMSGLSLNMIGLDKDVQVPHIQSFLYALDRVGIQVIRDQKAIFDCLAEPPRRKSRRQRITELDKLLHIVKRYELGMGTAILDAGYGLAPYLNPRQSKCDYLLKEEITNNRYEKKCRYGDMWHARPLKRMYFGRFPTLNETLFFKTSRILPLEIAQEIGYDAVEDTVWENTKMV